MEDALDHMYYDYRTPDEIIIETLYNRIKKLEKEIKLQNETITQLSDQIKYQSNDNNETQEIMNKK
jgi:uncharacterized coiled-coil protein SlyX